MIPPFQPESISRLAGRYKAALEVQYDLKDILQNRVKPGLQRTHIFDTHMGVRLVIFIAVFPNGCWMLSVSASPEGGILRKRAETGSLNPMEFIRIAEGMFWEIVGKQTPLVFTGFDEQKGFPVWGQVLTGSEPSTSQIQQWVKQWEAA